MRPIRLLLQLMTLLYCAGAALAQSPLPDHRFLYQRDVDFYGSDLTNLFDTTQLACERACAAQPSCVAFTFNSRSNSCFPKSAIRERQPYVGALSATKVKTPEALQGVALQRTRELDFLTPADLQEASALVIINTRRFTFQQETREDLMRALTTAETSGTRQAALSWAGKALTLTDEGGLWTRYAGLALDRAAQLKGNDRRRLNREALRAATNGYLRAGFPAAQVDALRTMARALEANRRGPAMIPALRLAQSIVPSDQITRALDDAIGKYGFRVTDHRVDSDAAQPRICAEFSEPLINAGMDYEPFVRIEGRGLVAQVSDRQLCIDGVEHGKRYDLTLRQGLPAASGESLHRDLRLSLYVRDRTPRVRFPGRAYVLPRSGEAALPVETVNVDRLSLKLRKVSDRNLVRAIRESYFGRPLSRYEEERFAEDLAEEVWSGEGEVENALNTDMKTRLPVGDLIAEAPAGIYALSAAVPGQDPYEYPAATQWFLLSDLGLSTWSGIDGMRVAVRRLSDASAGAGIRLTLISRANAVLGEAVTDAEGFALFAPGLMRGTGSSAPALLMAEEGELDLAFLSLTDPAFDLSDRGVEGRPPAPPIDTFLATDRGAYRVGETIHATVLTRDRRSQALEGLPVTAILYRPDGVEYNRKLSTGGEAGGHVFDLALGQEVPRGTWRLDIKSDLDAPALASQRILVEDFLPERIDLELSLPDGPLRLTDRPSLEAEVRYLFGAPGADLALEGEVRLRPKRERALWPGYSFGRHDSRLSPRTAGLPQVRTDSVGKAVIPVSLPSLDQDPGIPLEAEFLLRASEGSGRPVERLLQKEVQPAQPMIGIAPQFSGPLEEGSNAQFNLIGVAPDGAALPMDVVWTLNRVNVRYQWYQLNGSWEWEPITRRERVANGALSLGAEPTPLSMPTDWGRYELIVEQQDAPFAASSVAFRSGWYGGDGSKDTPDRLALTLDRESYAPGDTAVARFFSEGEATVLLTVLSNRVIESRVVAVGAGETRLPLEVTQDWGSGAYVTATLLNGLSSSALGRPGRALGLAHAAVTPGARALKVTLDVPEKVSGQEGSFLATVRVEGAAAGEPAWVTLAAVDQGILNLTGFEPPDPTDHYFGQRRLGVELRDLYGRLIDSRSGAMGRVRSGGDASLSVASQSPPPTERLMAHFSGPVLVDEAGMAEIEIPKPAFNGAIRLMAIAWTPSAVGQADKEVRAADPVVLTASAPRFMAPGDESRLLLELVHAEGPAGDLSLSLQAEGGLSVGPPPASLTLAEGEQVRLSLPLRAGEIGDHRVTLRLETPSGAVLEKVLTLAVRANDPVIATTRRFSLAPGETFTFDGNVFAGLRQGTGSATLAAGPLARLDVPGLLQRLDRYPYGCTEQITSAAMPLLYVGELARSSGLGAPAQLRQRVDDAIARVLARQASNGAFGLWRVSSGEFWLDAYVTDFLSRARARGHSVPERAFRLAMDNLRNRVSYAPDFDRGGEDLAYALLVLAREGAASMGDLRYYADTKANAFATPLALAQLGAALAAYGDPARADALFRAADRRLAAAGPDRGWRSDFGTSLRDRAAVIKLSAEVGSVAISPAMLLGLARQDRRHLSTQEAAQIVMAAEALARPGAAPGLEVDGLPASGPVVRSLNDRETAAAQIQNVSATVQDVTMTLYGVPEVPREEAGYGYRITRTYYDMEGRPIEAPVASGGRFVAVIEVTPFEEVGARLIVDDPLPAGYEIDNPNLLRSGSIRALDWLETVAAEHAEFRSDRFVAAVDHRGSAPFRLAYILRAVSPGSFHHPAATVEDMYRPEYRAHTGTGRVTVLP